jgi:hypothetical protein
LKNCQKIPVESFYDSDKYTFTMDCDIYNISSISMFGLSSNYDSTIENLMNCQNFTTYVNITADQDCSLQDYLNDYIGDKCKDKMECEFTIETREIQKKCTSFPKYDYFFFTYECYDNWVYVNIVRVERFLFSFIIVIIDVASMLALLITLFIMPAAQQSIDGYFKRKIVGINDYTLNFQNLGFSQEKLAEELDAFLKHLNNVYKIENPNDKSENLVYDINYPLIVDKKLNLIIKRNKVTQSLNKNQHILKAEGKDYSKFRMSRILNKIDRLMKEEDELRKKTLDLNLKELKKVDDIYVTFIHQKYRNKIFNGYNRNCCRRCCIIFFCQRKRIQHL